MRRIATITFALGALGGFLLALPAHADPATDARNDAREILGIQPDPVPADPGDSGGGGTGGGSGGGGTGGGGTGTGEPGGGTGGPTGGTGRPDVSPPSASPFGGALGAFGQILQYLAYGAAILAILGLIGFLVWALARWWRAPESNVDADDDETTTTTDLGLAEDDAVLRDVGPDELESLAAIAEANGDFATAVRYRFRAGLLRLATRGAITLEPNLTTGRLRRSLAEPTFERLSVRFDEIVYGDDTAMARDASDARDTWPRVLEAVRS